MIFVTGGAGFIGANFIRSWLSAGREAVLNVDALTYAGNLENLADLPTSAASEPGYQFSKTDICDAEAIATLFAKFKPRAIVHFAAESHVDRSIHGPAEFIRTNVNGTFTLLEAARNYAFQKPAPGATPFRFLHVSTDEVYGSLEPHAAPFSESTPYAPNSPYSASKAASDHLVRAYFHTYGLDCVTTNCSNNYGPYQFPEKLIPLVLTNALEGKSLPVYGDGKNVRDWLFVTDHCEAIMKVLDEGRAGETYNIGGLNERTNIEVVRTLCGLLDELRPKAEGSYLDQITFVKDRLGHDRRYAINADKIARELGWKPRESFETGIRQTVQWYLDHMDWVRHVKDGSYRDWINLNYAKA
ncbi:MAG: dTDP-glucose 4,6-dehydratase [Burkholderiaceae bacterium]|jgi:dTDP-glucose 4,6-dehydratase